MNSTPNTEKKNSNLIIILLAVIIALLVAVLAVFLLRGNNAAQSATPQDGGIPNLSYATTGTTVVDDQDALQAAVDEMNRIASQRGVALEYKGSASSTDGKVFSCYIANSNLNSYDMYIDVYGDAELTDHLFLSGLIRPGTAFDSIELEHPLEPGKHTVYCAFTQVEEDLETIHAQVLVTMEFFVQG